MSKTCEPRRGPTAADHVETIESQVYAKCYGTYRPDIRCLQQGDGGGAAVGAAADLSEAGGAHPGNRCVFCNGTGFSGPFACVHCQGTGHAQPLA